MNFKFGCVEEQASKRQSTTTSGAFEAVLVCCFSYSSDSLYESYTSIFLRLLSLVHVYRCTQSFVKQEKVLVVRMLLVAMPGAPSSVLAPSSKARSP